MRCPTCKTTMMLRALPEYDASDLFGLKAVLVKGVRAHMCPNDGEILMPGTIIERMQRMIVSKMLLENFVLVGNELRFLRKSVGLTQQRLADLVGVDRVTLTRWEAEEEKPIGAPESIAVRMVIMASEKSPEHAPKRATYREPPKPHPVRFELDVEAAA